jgi:hypothetical protein
MPSGGSVAGDASRFSCSLPTTRLDGYSDPPPTIPHTQYSRSCTLNSFNATTLVLQGYDINVEVETMAEAANGQLRKHATFTVYNPGSGDTYELLNLPVVDDGSWHDCVAGKDRLPWQLVSCRYQLDRSSNKIGFEYQWYCDDRDADHP